MASPVGPVSWSVATEGQEGVGPYAQFSTIYVTLYAPLDFRDLTQVRSRASLSSSSRISVLDSSATSSIGFIGSSDFSFGSWRAQGSPRIVSSWSDPVSGTTSVKWLEDRTGTRDAIQLFSRSSLEASDATETRSDALVQTFFSGFVVWDLTTPRVGVVAYSASSFEVRDQTGVRTHALAWAPDWEFIVARIVTGTRTSVLISSSVPALVVQDASGSRTQVEVEPAAWLQPPRAIVARPRRRSSRLQSV